MADPREVHVDVIVTPGNNPPFKFETADLPMVPDNHLKFNNCNHPGFCVHYDLKDPPAGYRFPDSTMFPSEPPGQHLKAALYCKVNSTCPTSPSTWGQFEAVEVKNNGNTLVVHNRNQSAAQFGYTLRVTNDNGKTFLDLDPVGTNSNGPSLTTYSMSLSTFAFSGAASALGALVAVLALYGLGVVGR
ncbi:MAG TPA: hypothetical protein VMK31_00865 [Sphingomicrobium sp.]|nr:hypothetical protein [Sphingomicrobium sp.]